MPICRPGGDAPEVKAHGGMRVGENAVSQGEQSVTVMPSSSCNSRISAGAPFRRLRACRREFPVAGDLAFRALGEQELRRPRRAA